MASATAHDRLSDRFDILFGTRRSSTHPPAPAASALQVMAGVHTDDRAVHIFFDATPWLEQALDRQIVALRRSDWAGEAADIPVLYCRAGETKPLFDYLKVDRGVDTPGFECGLDTVAARAWVEANRPHLL